jgi:hypothetical protein
MVLASNWWPRIYFAYILRPMAAEEFVPPAPRLRVAPILRSQRYGNLSQVSPVIRGVAEEMATLAEKLAHAHVMFLRRRIERMTPDTLTIGNGPTFHGRCFDTHLPTADEVVCFVLTIGPSLEKRVSELAEDDELLEALFLDTAGWLAIEDAARAFRAHLTARIRAESLHLSPRLGPGYLDWSLTEQAEFFSLFAGHRLDVVLSDHCVMTPKKSISGLFGLLPRT